VTDTSGHIQFLGWQPTMGELIINIIWPLVVALFVALLGPLRQWISQTRDFISDRIASLSANRRAKQINALELKIKNLRECNDRQIILLILYDLSRFVIFSVYAITLGILIIVDMIRIDDSLLWDFLAGVWSFLEQIFEAILILGHTSPKSAPVSGAHHPADIFYAQTFFVVFNVAMGLLLILSYLSAVNTLQDISDFSDPSKAIQRLEKRVNVLRAKSTIG
jgi:hypothetical protein